MPHVDIQLQSVFMTVKESLYIKIQYKIVMTGKRIQYAYRSGDQDQKTKCQILLTYPSSHTQIYSMAMCHFFNTMRSVNSVMSIIILEATWLRILSHTFLR